MPSARPEFELSSCPKGYSFDQDKATTPDKTLATAASRLQLIEGLSYALRERQHELGECAFSFAVEGSGYFQNGKGLTREQAQASGIMEYIERYSWLNFDYASRPGYQMTSQQELRRAGVATVKPEYFFCNMIDASPYADLVDECLRMPLRWVYGQSLISGEPYAYPLNWNNMMQGSNGLAAGNTFEEAILQGLCEVLERENFYRFLIEEREPRLVDTASLEHPLLLSTLAKMQEHGFKMTVLDLSGDLGVPCFLARGLTADRSNRLTRDGIGLGCHPDPQKAMIRCLSEYVEGYTQQKNRFEANPRIARMADQSMSVKQMGFVPNYNIGMYLRHKSVVTLAELPNLCRDNIKEELDHIVDLLRGRGYEVVVVNKTHRTLEVPVVRVFVPGMRISFSAPLYTPREVMAACYCEADLHERAEPHFRAALEEDPDNKRLMNNSFTAWRVNKQLQQHGVRAFFAGDYLAHIKRQIKTTTS